MSGTMQLSKVEMAGAFDGCTPEVAKDFHERRTSQRWAFPAVQPVAPYGHWGFPKVEMFTYVRCHDLSTGGISFVMKGTPQFEFGVIGLGPAAQRKFFVIRIVYRRERNAGTNEYLVGCMFVERIRPPAGQGYEPVSC
jgi:hypothetical protein